ncbi:MAG: YIP1 family protein [Bdellovibrionaceae bacterium]|nr:YIP1 family protein [Pseudobdellovibrionaceae bacterium]
MSFFSNLQYKTKKSVVFLIWFFKNPIEHIKRLPRWSLRNILLVHFLFSVVSGTIAGLISLKFWNILFGVLAFPFISMTLTLVLSSFIYYYFQVFEKKSVDFVQLLSVVVFANFPFFVFQIASNYVPIISIVGLLFTGMLLIVGLTENFKMTKRRAIRLVGTLWFLIFLVWLSNRFSVEKLDTF